MIFIHFLSYSLSSDTDVKNIVDQWKRSDFLTEGKGERRSTQRIMFAIPETHIILYAFLDPKIFDTRTFTRPKKRLFSSSDINTSFISKPGSSVAQVGI